MNPFLGFLIVPYALIYSTQLKALFGEKLKLMNVYITLRVQHSALYTEYAQHMLKKSVTFFLKGILLLFFCGFICLWTCPLFLNLIVRTGHVHIFLHMIYKYFAMVSVQRIYLSELKYQYPECKYEFVKSNKTSFFKKKINY